MVLATDYETGDPDPAAALNATNTDVNANTAALADKIDKSTLDANTVLYATADNTPAALAVGASQFVGRKSSGNVTALTVAEMLSELGWNAEAIQDLVGAMVSGNTESGIAVTYDDTNGKLDFSVSGAGSGPKDVTITTRTAGDVTVSSTSYVAVNSGLDAAVVAAAGDVLQISLNGLWDNQAVVGRLEAVTWVSGAAVNYVSGGNSGTNGVLAWTGTGSVFTNVGPPAFYTVQAGDISGGTVTIRILTKVVSGSKNIYAGASNPFIVNVVNLGTPLN